MNTFLSSVAVATVFLISVNFTNANLNSNDVGESNDHSDSSSYPICPKFKALFESKPDPQEILNEAFKTKNPEEEYAYIQFIKSYIGKEGFDEYARSVINEAQRQLNDFTKTAKLGGNIDVVEYIDALRHWEHPEKITNPVAKQLIEMMTAMKEEYQKQQSQQQEINDTQNEELEDDSTYTLTSQPV